MMFTILSLFIQKIVEEITARAVTYGQNQLDKRRSILSKLLNLYDALQCLRKISEQIYREVNGYALKNETPTKIISHKKLHKLVSAFAGFQEAKNEVAGTIEIYDQNLRTVLLQTENVKFSLLRDIIDVTDEILPRMEENNGTKTFILAYPRNFPNMDSSPVVDHSIDSREALATKSSEIRQKAIEEMDFIQVDIRNAEALQAALSEGRTSIDMMIKAEMQIAQLIRENFSIEQVFDSMGSKPDA